jgi:hypothetical protein
MGCSRTAVGVGAVACWLDDALQGVVQANRCIEGTSRVNSCERLQYNHARIFPIAVKVWTRKGVTGVARVQRAI